MSQQYTFEEEFHDGPQPHVSYQDDSPEVPSASYAAPLSPPRQSYASKPGKPPLVQSQNATQQQSSSGYGARATLAIFSIFFVLVMFLVALIMHNMANPGPFNSAPADPYVFAVIFAVIVLFINLMVNRRR